MVVRVQLTGKSWGAGAAEGRSCLPTMLQKAADCVLEEIWSREMNDSK